MPPTATQNTNRNAVSIPLAIIAAGAMIAAAVYFGGGKAIIGGNPLPNDASQVKIEPVSNADHLFGSRNAEVVIIEYSDLECPFCKAFHSTMHQIVDMYQGRVAWVYRHFPIAELHSRAHKEAEASECAFDQGGNDTFWKYIDKVFAITGTNNTLDPAELPKIAQSLGLDVAKFNECLSSGKYAEAINKSVEASIAAGALGTPYSIIVKGDRKIEINGAEPFESIKAKIDSLLK
ncbi:DsbA family protein [Candidatus Parcubacteria bacterium]|nr:DsbA family protein [Candidatus Parcubacteria bacterium]